LKNNFKEGGKKMGKDLSDVTKFHIWVCTYCFYVELYAHPLPIYSPMKCPKCGSIMNKEK
jgi:predicted nucleic-acid-binding Zn-ribbon protein